MKYEQILLLSAKEARKRQKELFAKNGVQLWKNFILPAFQVPLWIMMSITMRDLSGWSSWDNTHNKALDRVYMKKVYFGFKIYQLPIPCMFSQ